jgi:hypothetical protein
MKKLIMILIVLACLLLVVTAKASRDPVLPNYMVQVGVVTGGNYTFTSMSWQVSGATQSQRYFLASPATPDTTDNGCCCLFLPCLRR